MLLHRSLLTDSSVLSAALDVADPHQTICINLFNECRRQNRPLVERVTVEDEQEARLILERYDDKDFFYTDATSFVVMERLGLNIALSLDGHFVQYGRFLVLPLMGDRLPGDTDGH